MASEMEGRIAKLAAALSDLEKLNVGEEVVQPLKDELQELKIAALEERVAELKANAGGEPMGMVVPSAPAPINEPPEPPTPVPVAAPTPPRPKELAAAEAAYSLNAVLRGIDYGQRACTPAELGRLRAAMASARSAGVPEADMAMAEQLQRQAMDKSEALAAAEREAEAKAAKAAEALAEARLAALSAIDAALRAMDYGQRPCTMDELGELRAAMDYARSAGVPASDIAMAEQLERQAMDKAAALSAAEREAEVRARQRAEARMREAAEMAAAQKAAAAAKIAAEEAEAIRVAAAQEKARVEMKQAMEEVKRSVAMPGAKRKQLLRELQVKWHPDRQSEDADEETKELALELSMKLNEAMRIAKENMRARGEM